MNVAVRELQALFEVGSLGGLSDGQLLDRFVQRREEEVFEAIVRRHGPMVWGVCRRVLRDHHDAEDAFQTTFVVLARKAASVMIREKLGNWLYGVAYQTAMKARAMRSKRRWREGQVSDMPKPMAVPNDLRDDLAEALDWELSRLPEKYRIPIVLCELQGMSQKEAANQLGWPIGTVSSRLSRARSMLAKRLTRRGLSLSVGSLAVLLAQESASASMPTQLIISTARAASLFTTGGVMSAGVVSAGVAALTREVMKMMLLSKLKIGVLMLLVASAVAASGTGLAFQAQAVKQGQKEELERLIDEKRQELQQLIDRQQKEGERTAGQDQRKTRKTVKIVTVTDYRSDAGPSPGSEPLISLPAGLEGIAEYSPDQLRHQKEYIDAMIEVENARNKTPEQLDQMIREKTKVFDHFRWCVLVTHEQIVKLKKIRDTGQIDKNPRANNNPSNGVPSRQ
jgi:RNA polymerase sigma factor (sigma-70 family)